MTVLARVLLVAALLVCVLTALSGWSWFVVLSALLTAGTLVLVRDGLSRRSRVLGFVTVAWMYWGLTYVSNMIEAMYFAVISGKEGALAIGSGLCTAMLAAGVLELLTAHREVSLRGRAVLRGGMWWRLPLLLLVFILLYLAAGAAIYPWIANFYASRHLPTFPQLFRLQLGRGAFDLLCIYPVYRQWGKAKSTAMGMSACVFPVLCGWAPLLLPSALLPGKIRLAHAVEMGAFGVVFGAVAAVLLLQNSRGLRQGGAATMTAE